MLLDQLELALDELTAIATEDELAAEKAAAGTTEVKGFVRRKPSRKPFPEHLPRERVVVPAPKGKTGTARACVYVRDDAPFGGPDLPAALFHYSWDRSGDHPVEHLRTFTGILQADAYAGYRQLYEHGRSPGPVIEALCWRYVAVVTMLPRDAFPMPNRRAGRVSAT